MEYIKLDAEKTSEEYTKKRLDSAFTEWAVWQYGKDNAEEILQQIGSMKKLVFNGTVLSLTQMKSNEDDVFADHANAFALEALDECMDKIANQMNFYNEDEIFDNGYLLDDFHAIIEETYNIYAKKCNSNIDAKALEETLGVLYGSIEYWTNSDNVKSWSNIFWEEDEDSIRVTSSLPKSRKNRTN